MTDEEILIVGAGPAGIATSLFLSKKKIRHIIIDKEAFPRDKICGDALSGKVVHVLNKLDPEILKALNAEPLKFTGSYGICFFSPGGRKLEVPFAMNPAMIKNAPGFISRRIVFDHFLFNRLDTNYASVFPQTELIDLERKDGGLTAVLKNRTGTFRRDFKLVVGAEGDRSMVAKKLSPRKKDPDHYCAAVRAYYKGVTGMHEKNFIELHFIKELLPGYFWIFPMNDGTANVGIGMLSREVSEKIIQNHPGVKERFEKAELEGSIQGWGLPLGSLRRTLAGDNFLLTGDAGSLIDPFTGEGIGNALFSGMLASETIAKAMNQNNFSNEFLKEYETNIYHKLNDELRLSHGIQKLAKFSWLFNFVVRKASKNKMLQETITCMFDDIDIRSRLRKPSFYFKLFFNTGS
jgi:geranylgeranyl reductase family protein